MTDESGAGDGAGEEEVITKEEHQAVLAELEKLKEKELNFKKLRNMKENDITEEKKVELTSFEEKLKEMESSLEQKHKSFVESQFNRAKEDRLKELVGDDKELRDKIEYHYGRLSDETTTAEEITKKIDDAYMLATGDVPSKSPIRSVASAASAPSYKGKARGFSETDEGKGALKQWFPNLDWDKK